MRFSAIDAETDEPVRFETNKLPPGSAPPPAPVKTDEGKLVGSSGKIRWQWLPRIRCNDCPGKLYTAQPVDTEAQFEVHLRNKNHREKVEERRRRVKDGEGGRSS